jgi:hypothetical protein
MAFGLCFFRSLDFGLWTLVFGLWALVFGFELRGDLNFALILSDLISIVLR